MATRAVLDADVWVAAFLGPSGASAELLRSLEAREFQAVWSQALLAEVREVLADPQIRHKYRVRPFEVQLLLEIARRYGREAVITGQEGLSDDPGDDKVVETAIRGKARYLVTFNARHFTRGKPAEHLARRGITALRPARFLEVVRPPAATRRQAGTRAARLIGLRGKSR